MPLILMNILGRNTLVKVTLAPKIRKKPLPKKIEKDLHKQATAYLESLEGNNTMPWFHLKGATAKTKNTYADFFIAQWNRNAYGGLFVHIDPDSKSLTAAQKKWVEDFREKGYACAAISKLEEFKLLIQDYYHSQGQRGRQYFNNRWERI